MDKDEIKTIIADICYFQSYEMHEEAIDIAMKIPMDSLDVDKMLKVYKLISLSYRKLKAKNAALLYINKAIVIAKGELKKQDNDKNRREFGICLMNKGVIYDSFCDYRTACSIYSNAILIFKRIKGLEDGLMVNALINYGEALFNYEKKQKSICVLEEALSLVHEKSDVRYEYINNKIDLIIKTNDK